MTNEAKVAEQVAVPNTLESITPGPRTRGTVFEAQQRGELTSPLTTHALQQLFLTPNQISQGNRMGNYVGTLAELPNANSIADFLAREGFKGVRSDLKVCPIAAYLSSKLGEGKVEVDPEQISYEVSKGNFYFTANTPAIREFVKNFNEGRYPHLVA